MPYGIYKAENVPGAYPGCTWSTWTQDGLPIDVYNETLTKGSFTAEVLSPAIVKFESNACTPWVKVQ